MDDSNDQSMLLSKPVRSSASFASLSPRIVIPFAALADTETSLIASLAKKCKKGPRKERKRAREKRLFRLAPIKSPAATTTAEKKKNPQFFFLLKPVLSSPCQRRHDLVGLARAVVDHQIARALERLHEGKVREEEDFSLDVAGTPAPDGRGRGDNAEGRRRFERPAHFGEERRGERGGVGRKAGFSKALPGEKKKKKKRNCCGASIDTAGLPRVFQFRFFKYTQSPRPRQLLLRSFPTTLPSQSPRRRRGTATISLFSPVTPSGA